VSSAILIGELLGEVYVMGNKESVSITWIHLRFCISSLHITKILSLNTSPCRLYCTMSTNWEQLAADKRKRIHDSIPSDWRIQDLPNNENAFSFPKESGLLSAREIELTESSATELVAQLAEGKLKSVDVTLAFCKRAALAQQLVSFSYGTDSVLVSKLINVS